MKINNDTEELLKTEWDIEKNGKTFEDGKNEPDKETWWKCSEGHKWQAKIKSRVQRRSKCPYCAGLKAVTGVNDVATLYPDLTKEFHPTKNGNVRLEDYKESSGKKVWWMCSKGHEWQAVINTRTKRGYGCPVCSGQKIVPGINDFKTLYPQIAKEVHPVKNEKINITLLGGKSPQRLVY